MTSYSTLPTGPRTTVLATWPGETADVSAKVTTVGDAADAATLALDLTRLSEAAWDAAAWLDTTPVIERGVVEFAAQLRDPGDEIAGVTVDSGGLRHDDQWSFTEASMLLATDLPESVARMTRAQRLTVADELEADASARLDAVRFVSAGQDPMPEARGWQLCQATRVLRNGLTGPLPEGAASWLVRSWGPDLVPADRWAARCRLVRIEQLTAACVAHGGRGRPEADSLLAHLVLPAEPGAEEYDAEVIYVSVHEGPWNSWDTPVTGPMTVTRRRSTAREEQVLGEFDPGDDDGFAAALGLT